MPRLIKTVGWLGMGLLALALLAPLSTVTADTATEQKWEWLDDDDGIRVWKREIPGSDMPGFRGQTHIAATVDDILKTMLDWKHHTEWMHGCVESSVLQEISSSRAIMYNRVAAPWPVWDRDVIADTELVISADRKAAIVTFKNIDSKLRPLPEKVVRLPRLVGFYKMWQVEPTKTKILYQVEADPGGSIPRWLAIRGAKDLPYQTLDQLRERVEKANKPVL